MKTGDKEVIAHSINEFLDTIFEIEDSNPENGENKKAHLYRGQGSKDWELLPSIARGKDNDAGRVLFHQEEQLIETAKHRMPKIFRQDMLPVDMLALLQHYGIPTRLLDVTQNPLVALFFACRNEEDDGEVIVFEHDADYVPNYALANAIADSYRLIQLHMNSLDAYFRNITKQAYFFEGVITQDNYRNNGAKWLERWCKDELIFVHAQEQLERQKLQQGQFIVFPNKIITEEGKSCKYFDFSGVEAIDKNGRHVKRRILISRDSKQKMLDRLELLGICEGTLFMDSVDSVCRQITNEARKRITYEYGNG